MKRRIFKLCPRILLFLLLGAILNIAVASICAVWATEFDARVVQPPSIEMIREKWSWLASPSWPDAPVVQRHDTGNEGSLYGTDSAYQPSFGSDSLSMFVWQGTPSHYSGWSASYTTSGWPLRSFQGGISQFRANTGFGVTTEKNRRMIQVTLPRWLMRTDNYFNSPIRNIPTDPLWPGFAINTIFYAAILWLLVAFPGALGKVRRRIRAHRGRCTACGYDLRGHLAQANICPECGAPTHFKRIAA